MKVFPETTTVTEKVREAFLDAWLLVELIQISMSRERTIEKPPPLPPRRNRPREHDVRIAEVIGECLLSLPILTYSNNLQMRHRVTRMNSHVLRHRERTGQSLN